MTHRRQPNQQRYPTKHKAQPLEPPVVFLPYVTRAESGDDRTEGAACA
jgi:hypothetical protein